MLTLLCSVLTARAGVKVTDLSQLSNDKVYAIRSARGFLLYSDKVPDKLCTNTGSAVGSVTYRLNTPDLQFRIEQKGES